MPPPRPQARRTQPAPQPTAALPQPDAGWARPDRRPDRRPAGGSRGGRYTLRVCRVLVAVVSVVVLAATGYSWAQVQKANGGLNRANVIDPGMDTMTGPQNILLVGIDTRVDAQGNPLPAAVLNQLHAGTATDGADATDTMIVVHIPAGGGKAIGFSIPRDAYVDIAGGYGKHKINSAYTYAETAALKQLRAQGVSGPSLWVQAAQAGAKNAIQTVQQFTGLTINHYAAVNLVGFYTISQAIGGVQVCLKRNTKDSFSGANFTAGPHTISGADALAFVRQRHDLPLGDLDRIRRQQVFLAAMAKAVLSGGTLADPGKLNALINAIQGAITLDQNWDILSFAQQMQGISGGAIQFFTVPIVSITLKTPTDGDAVEVNPQAVQAYVQQQINGTTGAAAPATTSAATPTSANSAHSGVVVDVYNANGAAGLAGVVRDNLVARGYTKGQAVTTTTRTHSVIDYAPGSATAARDVSNALGGGITLVSDSALATGHVRIYLGRDYTGPGMQSGTAPQAFQQAAPTTTAPAAPTDAPITANGVPCID